jgi:hypothetical protein
VAHRQFGTKRNDDDTVAPEPISFDMVYEKDILCRERVNGKLLLELVGKVESGSVTKQAEGIVQVFTVCVRTDDGENPDQWTGKRYDPEHPLANHTSLELEAIREDNVVVREEAEEAVDRENERRRNAAKAKAAKASKEGEEPQESEEVELAEVDYESPDLVTPGLDPTCSLARLDKVLDDPNTVIEVDELAEIVGWLVEQYTGRPTRKSAKSRTGSGGTNRSSRRARRTSAVG